MSAMPGDAGIEGPISPLLETVQPLKILPLSAKSVDYEARIFNHLKLHFKNKVELATAELRPIAGGSPNGNGKHWLNERDVVRLGRRVRAAQDDFEKVQRQRSGADHQVHRSGAGQLQGLFGALVFQLNRRLLGERVLEPFLKVGPRTQLWRWIPFPQNFGFCQNPVGEQLFLQLFFLGAKLAVWGLADHNPKPSSLNPEP